jgi:hypothetical protein
MSRIAPPHKKYWKSDFPGTIAVAIVEYEKANNDGLGRSKFG